ncbi:MAG: tetratricopeptide repeat protein [Syntrophotaleaceae bacterium]
MSLINQMLKDLEARQQEGIAGQSIPVLRARAPGWRRLPRLIAGCSVVLLLVGGMFWFWNPKTPELPTLADKKPMPGMAEKPAPVAQPPAGTPDSAEGLVSNTVALQAIRAREVGSFIHFEADFDRPPVYHFTVAKDRRSFHLDLVAVRQTVELPPVVRQRWLAGLQARQSDTGLAVSLILQPTATIRDYSATMQVAGSGYRLLLDLYPEAPAAASQQPQAPSSSARAAEVDGPASAGLQVVTADPKAVRPGVATVASPMSSENQTHARNKPSAQELAEQAYRKGQVALAAGRHQDGVAALLQALEQHPEHLAARQALVSELLRQKRQAEAGQVLAEGLRLDPTLLPMRLRYAELLMGQDKLVDARDLLLQGPPQTPLAAPELHALLGAIYQRLGQYQAAAQEYQALLTAQPGNGLWQMGLGIAREHAGAPEEAVDAYRAALAGQGLSPALNDYVRQRLAALQP